MNFNTAGANRLFACRIMELTEIRAARCLNGSLPARRRSLVHAAERKSLAPPEMLNLRRPLPNASSFSVAGVRGLENGPVPIPHVGFGVPSRASMPGFLLGHFLDTFRVQTCIVKF